MHGELAKAIALSGEMMTVSHYRDKDGVEVDLVLERSPETIVGIEVKAGATARPRDFQGLRRLKEAAGRQARLRDRPSRWRAHSANGARAVRHAGQDALASLKCPCPAGDSR